MSHEDVSSLTISTKATLLTAIIEAEAGQDIMMLDIPGAFVQTKLEKQDKDGNRMIMKLWGVLVDILIEMDPIYKDFAIIKGTQKVLYVHITRAIYDLLVPAILFYKRLVGDLKYRFILNP